MYYRRDVTIDLIKYRWLGFRLMTGKLDWILLRNFKVNDGVIEKFASQRTPTWARMSCSARFFLNLWRKYTG
jgi:hypothetical protein